MLSAQGLRADGRRSNELRSIQLSFEKNGVVLYKQGGTVVSAYVIGPEEGPNAAVSVLDLMEIECKIAAFSGYERKYFGKNAKVSKHVEEIVRKTMCEVVMFDMTAKWKIKIVLQVFEDDGGLVAALVNVATAALVLASIPMKDYVVACSAGIVQSKVCLDPSRRETKKNTPEIMVAVKPHEMKIVTVEMKSKFPKEYLEEMVQLAMEGATGIYEEIKATVKARHEATRDNL